MPCLVADNPRLQGLGEDDLLQFNFEMHDIDEDDPIPPDMLDGTVLDWDDEQRHGVLMADFAILN